MQLIKHKLLSLPRLADYMQVSYSSLRSLREKGLLNPAGFAGPLAHKKLYTEHDAIKAFEKNTPNSIKLPHNANKINYNKLMEAI